MTEMTEMEIIKLRLLNVQRGATEHAAMLEAEGDIDGHVNLAIELSTTALSLHAQLQQEREARERAETELTHLRGRPRIPWDRSADQDAVCTCGHAYHRHFDSYEDMEPVGCKYCECIEFQPAPHAEAGEEAL